MAKKGTSTKNSELAGSNVVNPPPSVKPANSQVKDKRTSDMNAVLGSRGATDAISGYKDNDITANLVNSKHTNPTISAAKDNGRVGKASSKVSWEHKKGSILTLQ